MNIKQIVRDNVGWIITGLLILLFLLLFFWERIFISIYPGQAGVLYRRLFNDGTDIQKVYPEGLSIILPWNKMFIYNVRVQEKKQTVNVLSQNGLTIQVNVSVRYYLDKEKTPILHQKVGPDFERKIIIPSTISSVREVVGEYLPEELYTTARHIIQDKLLIEVVEETGRIPIVYDALIVENIKLPDLINSAIEAKLRQQQRFLEYKYKIKQAEAEITRKENEAIGIQQYQNIIKTSLTPDLLKWKGIMATLELAKSPNSKVVVVGGGEGGLPIIFNAEGALNTTAQPDTQDYPLPGFHKVKDKDKEEDAVDGEEKDTPASGSHFQSQSSQMQSSQIHSGQSDGGQNLSGQAHDDQYTSKQYASGLSASELSAMEDPSISHPAKGRFFMENPFRGLLGKKGSDEDQTNGKKERAADQ